jgi:hypothetical protein
MQPGRFEGCAGCLLAILELRRLYGASGLVYFQLGDK